jgi:methylase of polypeptide subunit release factors
MFVSHHLIYVAGKKLFQRIFVSNDRFFQDGLAVIRRLVAGAGRPLAPGGALVLECGGGEQTAAVIALMQEAGFVEIATRRDLVGIDRFVAGRRGGA